MRVITDTSPLFTRYLNPNYPNCLMENTNFFEKLTNKTEPFIIAEIGSNHMGETSIAKELIDAAKEAGCHCVKFQSWAWNDINSKVLFEKRKDYTAPGLTEVGLEAVNKKCQLTKEQHVELKQYCDEIGIYFASSPFGEQWIDILDELDVPFYKIGSMEVTNLDWLRKIAKKGRPIIMSTGMCELSEISRAVEIMKEEGNDQIVLLHCVALYPPGDEFINLEQIRWLKNTFNLPVGFSDHSKTIEFPLASIALGASVIEKHFMLSEERPCREKKVSITKEEMTRLCEYAKRMYIAKGTYYKVVSVEEKAKRVKMRRSILTTKDLPAGHVISRADIIYKRPGNGIPCFESKAVIGRKLNRNIPYDEVIKWEDIE